MSNTIGTNNSMTFQSGLSFSNFRDRKYSRPDSLPQQTSELSKPLAASEARDNQQPVEFDMFEGENPRVGPAVESNLWAGNHDRATASLRQHLFLLQQRAQGVDTHVLHSSNTK